MMNDFLKNRYYILAIFIMISCNDHLRFPDPLEAGWEGSSVCEVIEDNTKLRVLKCTFPPNVGHELHYHNPHYGYTIKGSKFRIKDASGTRDVNVAKGYSFSKNEVSTHEVLNIGDSTAIFLIMEYK